MCLLRRCHREDETFVYEYEGEVIFLRRTTAENFRELELYETKTTTDCRRISMFFQIFFSCIQAQQTLCFILTFVRTAIVFLWFDLCIFQVHIVLTFQRRMREIVFFFMLKISFSSQTPRDRRRCSVGFRRLADRVFKSGVKQLFLVDGFSGFPRHPLPRLQ